MRIPSRATALLAAAVLAACKSADGNNGPADLCPSSDDTREGTRVELDVGESARMLDAASAACVLVAGGGSRYVISVANTGLDVSSTVGFQLVGAGASASASVSPPPVAAPLASRAALFAGPPDARALERARRYRAGHERMLRMNASLVRGMGSARAAWATERARRRALESSRAAARVSAAPGGVGTYSEVRILNRDNPGGGLCSNVNHIPIRARTVYVGTRSIVLEDSLSPLAGRMDTAYVRLGQEFDRDMYPILEQYFGNPLALDPELDNNGKVVMVFSPKINDFGDISGFVLNCDFFPRAQAAVSNEGEYFYALVPDSLGGGIRDWDRGIRSTLIHEVKHVTSNAARFTNPDADELESRWLEEGTAVHAEELWARTQFGNTWKGNATYAQTLFCEVRLGATTNTQCRGKPFVMYGNYSLLYDYLEQNERYTPLGPIDDDDFVFYGAAWSLVRWAADNYAANEAAFFRGLTQSSLVGVQNLEDLTGRPWAEMLSDWTLALATDDRAGVTPDRPQLTIPSWDTRSIFGGMNQDFPDASGFPRLFPLQPRMITFGEFTQTVASLRAGTASIFELSGSSGSSQILELRSATGTAAAPTTLVMQILRIQ